MKKPTLISLWIVICVAATATGCGDKKKQADKTASGAETSPVRKPLPRADKRAVALALGTRLATAALLRAEGASDKILAGQLRQMRLLAKLLGAPPPAFPARAPDKAADLIAMLAFLRNAGAKPIRAYLETKYSPHHAALFSLGIEMHVLDQTYSPMAKDNADRAQKLLAAAAPVGLPAAAEATASAMRESRPKAAVSGSFAALRAAVANHLRPAKK